jgi:hypothetical protein
MVLFETNTITPRRTRFRKSYLFAALPRWGLARTQEEAENRRRLRRFYAAVSISSSIEALRNANHAVILWRPIGVTR